MVFLFLIMIIYVVFPILISLGLQCGTLNAFTWLQGLCLWERSHLPKLKVSQGNTHVCVPALLFYFLIHGSECSGGLRGDLEHLSFVAVSSHSV